jgi:SAM-dependent methyltransferase
MVINNIKKNIPKHLNRDNMVLMDLGCGYEARILQRLERYMKQGIGLDFEVSGKIRENPKFLFYEGDIISRLPLLENESIDFMVCLSILEHLEDPVFVLQHARRLLKPRGRLFFCSPSWFGKWVTENIIMNKFLDPDEEVARQVDTHKMYYTPRDMWPLLVKAGFVSTEIKIWRSNFFISTSGYAEKL